MSELRWIGLCPKCLSPELAAQDAPDQPEANRADYQKVECLSCDWEGQFGMLDHMLLGVSPRQTVGR